MTDVPPDPTPDPSPEPDPPVTPSPDPAGDDQGGGQQVDPTTTATPVVAPVDVPIPNPEPGESIPDEQIPYPSWMTALDDPGADYSVAFRLRGRRPDQSILRNVAGIDAATLLARRYQALGWGGDATVTRLADGAIMGVVYAPLTAQDAPI